MMLLTDHRTINNNNNNKKKKKKKKNTILATKKPSLYFDPLLLHLSLKERVFFASSFFLISYNIQCMHLRWIMN